MTGFKIARFMTQVVETRAVYNLTMDARREMR